MRAREASARALIKHDRVCRRKVLRVLAPEHAKRLDVDDAVPRRVDTDHRARAEEHRQFE
jgi:hypothetical protein